MGDSKLCLLLLLTTSALAFAQDEDPPACQFAQWLKSLHKYEYQYETESLNAINGASQLKNGPKASCKVEVEVPRTCSFILHTTGCKLSEVVDTEADGNPVFSPAANSDAFAAEMEKYPLKFVVEGEYDVKLYPEAGETTTILNFKRGIISALAVPLLEEDGEKNMPTIHGKCWTHQIVNASEDIDTDITLKRDLSRCDKFLPIRDHSSPLALITGMHFPLAQLVRSSQTCNYMFDNKKKHMISGSCTENHILVPFSNKGKYGVTNMGKQELTLVQVSAHNDRVFVHGDTVKDLNMEAVEDKSAFQDKEAVLNVMRELVTLPEAVGEKRAHLFHTLVSTVRGMKSEVLRAALPEAVQMSRFLTYQFLAQCGTPECSSAIMMILRTIDVSSIEADAAVFALGLMSNPSALLINDMLEMAKYKPSKPIMYALSNVVKRFYTAEGKLIPEIHSVAEFMASRLGDCTGENDNTFMTLRVVGNMAPAVIPASPALRNAVMNCVKQPAASQQVQQAAIQVYRQIPVPSEGRSVFMQVLLDNSNSVQERIAAYLILMKDPQTSELTQLANVLSSQEDQIKSFIISHIRNIMSSTEPETDELRRKIQDAFQSNEIEPTLDPINFSRNFKIGSMQGNMIFEGVSYLPKEVMLEMTLKAFGFEIDMMEIGMEGKGFETTIDALFGENGFFPDTSLKTMYFVSDKMPQAVNEILENVVPGLKRNRMRRQTSNDLMKEIEGNLKKLVEQLKGADSPEAMVYLRLLGNELGYLRTNDFEEMTYSAGKMIENMLKMFPSDILRSLLTNPDNSIFAHYIFMDNEFFLPTMTGVPLRIALSGTFTPGFKGGLQIARDMSTFTFMPAGGIEFVSQIGCHIPEYVNSGLEMHTNIFHESGIRAKFSMGRHNVKLTVPALTKPTRLIEITNTLVAVTGSEVKTIPPVVMDKVDFKRCTGAFTGINLCTALQYVDASSHETAPYFPLTGDSKFVVELHPTGKVTEYTAAITYELLKEGVTGQQVDSLKFILRAEGAEPTEARLVMNYNKEKKAITADIQIPDYDVEAGIRLGIDDGKAKSKGTHAISLDFVNKHVPQLSIVGRANLKAMKEGMLQVQILVPSVKAESTLTANLKRDEGLELELESEIKIMDATSEQKIEMKYDGSKIEVEVKSDVNTKTTSLPNGEFIKQYANEILDMRVAQTDMKIRHIFRKFVEAANNHMEKYGAEMLPYMQNFRLPDIPEISLPEKLFLKSEAKAVYHFNDEHFTITIPLLFGGKSTTELFIPPVLTIPRFSLPQFGLDIASREIAIEGFRVPEDFTLHLPLFGKVELSAMMTSNLYDVEATLGAGKDVVEPPSYSAKFDLKGTSPIDILSVAVEGSGMVSMKDSIKAHLRSAFTHKFFEAKISIEEEGIITSKINLKSISKIEATSPLGLHVALGHTAAAGISTQEINADSNFEGSLMAGPLYGKTNSTQSFTIFPFKPEAKMDSNIQFDSTIFKAQNTIAATLGNGEVSVVSDTNAFEDVLTHAAELSFKDNKLLMKCESNVLALGMKIHNLGEASAGAGEFIIRMEINGDHSDNRVYSLLTGSLDVNGLTVNYDANVKLLENEATHKVVLKMNKDGLSTKGKTTLHSPLSLENTFEADIGAKNVFLLISNNAAMSDFKVDNTVSLTITLSSLDFKSQTEAIANEYASYTHLITFNLKPYTALASVSNQIKLLDTSFLNEAQLKAGLFTMELTGVLKAKYDKEEIKHTYQIHYADLSATTKCSTTGKLFGTHMSNNIELEIVGLAAKFTHDSHFNSQPIRFDHTLRWSIVPFDFNLDAIFSGDGDMNMYGKHSAQLYGKFQLRAQPLAFASLHECRASVTQQLDQGFSLETTYDHKLDTVLSPQEQKSSFRIKSKMNENSFNQIVVLYNTADKTGIELSGTILTNILNTDDKEFTLSGFLEYDKNIDSHIIHFPLIENLPVLLESVKGFVVYVAEDLQDFINNEEMRAKLETLPQNIDEILSQINLEDTLNQLKQLLTDFPQNYNITLEDAREFLENLKTTIMKLITGLGNSFKGILNGIDDAIFGGTLNEIIGQKIKKVTDTINDITPVISQWIDALIRKIDQTDLEKLKGSSIQFLHDIERQYNIKAKVQLILTDVKENVDRFDAHRFARELKEIIRFFKHVFNEIFFSIVHDIPTNLISDITIYVDKMMLELDIVNKINYVNVKMKELLAEYDVDKKALAVLEKAVNLAKQFKIQESFQAMVELVKDADNIFIEFFQAAVRYLRTTDVKDILDHVNMCIEALVQELKSLKYKDFVDDTNQIITEFTTYGNAFIRSQEIPKKLEATREFLNTILSSIQGSMEHMREIKVAEMITFAQDIFEKVVCDSLRRFAEYLKMEIRELNIQENLSGFLNDVASLYKFAYRLPIDLTKEFFHVVFDYLKKVSDEKIIREIQQNINGFFTELGKMEILTPSLTIPFTDLIVPSIKLSMHRYDQIRIPPKIHIPQFTILGTYTVKATTISFDEMKQKIIELIDFIVNLEIKLLDVDDFFGNLTLKYLPSLPEITLPEFTLPEVTLPTIPQLPVENLVSLEIPEIKLPPIPKEITVPCFGKLHGEIKFHSPIYTLKMTAAFQNATQNKLTPIFMGYFTSQGTSPGLEILNYTLDTSARISIPKMKRFIFTETVTFNHVSIEAEHQASVTLYGQSGQGQAKTTIKVNTSPYSANFMNTAYIAVEKGMTAIVDTTYNHVMDIPLIDVSNEVAITQKSTAQQDGFNYRFTADNSGTGNYNDHDFKHLSKLELSFSPRILTLSFSGDTVAPIIKMRQNFTAESRPFSHFEFSLSNEAEAPVIKNSLIVASGFASIQDMKIEIKANHDTELHGADSGVISNVVNFKICPVEFVFEFQNKANTRMNLLKSLNAKIELQYDYVVNLNPNSQKMSEVFLARLNQYKAFYNLTLYNNRNDASLSIETEGQADLYFLKYPISIPEIELPFIDFHLPAITGLNLYEQTGLQNILTTTEQTFNMDAKVLYQKSKAAPLVVIMDPVHIPSMGKLTTDLSFKSAIFNLNANSLLFAEDDLTLSLGVNTASVFKYLEAKLEGSTSLTTMRGIKLATSLSFDNPHIKSTLESTISMSTETFETAVSVASFAKINLPILNLEASQNLIADTKSKANALSDLKILSVFNIPWIDAVGKAETEHSFKLEGNSKYISVESSIKSNMNGKVFENCQILGVLDNEANLYLNGNSFRSTSKVTADAKFNHGATKVINMDVNNNLAAEASVGRVYAELKHSSNNEANLFSFITQGKHNAQAAFNFESISSMTSNVEIDMTQRSNFGDFTYSEKAVGEVTNSKQKFSTNIKFASPVYTTSMKAEVEGSAPILQITFNSSATSPFLILEYDLDAHSTTNLEHLNMDSKLVFLHSDLSVDVKHVIGQVLRSKRQADESVSNHNLNVDITSPTFTDVNLRYTEHKDTISASVSTPTAGFLALQLDGRNPFQMNARIYGRFLSRSEDDVNILVIRSSKDADKTNMQIVYNLEAPKMIISELKKTMPSIISSFITFADKYQITRSVAMLNDFTSSHMDELYNSTASYDVQMSQMSVFFRNTIVRYQKNTQAVLDAFIKVLRETRFKLPGSDKMTTLPELLKELTTIAANILEETLQCIYENRNVYCNYLVQKIHNVKAQMPIVDAITESQIINEFKTADKEIFYEAVDYVKNMESLDTMLEMTGKTLKTVVEITQEMIDSIKCDYLDDVFMKINKIHNMIVRVGREPFDNIPSFSMEEFLNLCAIIMINITEYIHYYFDFFFLQNSDDLQPYMVVRGENLEINLPLAFQY